LKKLKLSDFGEVKKIFETNLNSSGLYMEENSQHKYRKTPKGKKALARAQKKYDGKNLDKRRAQKREYMRRKRAENPNYCKWK